VAVWFSNAVEGFRMPILLRINGEDKRVVLSQKATQIQLDAPLDSLEVDRNFYVKSAEYVPPAPVEPEAPVEEK
ncbi:MAG: hypothetical protein KDB61_03140, partial [Planctomycetes bacterium]|nr:hypothetical protein [Planctomycetota bacterium]